MNRAYSTFETKSINEDQRIIEGIASTPSTDRVGDIVEPMGARFALPIPFLMGHGKGIEDSVGHVISANVTPEGILIRAQIESDPVLPELDKAWARLKKGLVRGLSIGFKSIGKPTPINGGGLHFKQWSWLELSGVVIPANADASITTIKAISDDSFLAASGKEKFAVVRLGKSPGASGTTKQLPKGIEMAKTTQELIGSFEQKRAAVVGSMTNIMEKSAEDGATLDEEQTTQYDDAATELKTIDAHLERLKKHEQIMLTKATAITHENTKNEETASNTRGGVITVKDNLPPGIEFARYAMCLATAKGNLGQAVEIAKNRYQDNPRIETVLKAAVAAGTTTDATWAAPLVQYQQFAGDFIEFLRPKTIIGQFGTNGIPSLRRVPFNIQVAGQTSGGAGYWVGEGLNKPLTKFDYANVTLRWAKVANIAVITEELARFSTPSAETLVRDSLAAAIIERLDIDFIDPAKAAVTNVSPASITNGLTGIVTAGNELIDIAADVRAVFGTFITAGMSPTQGVWIMSEMTALTLSQMVNTLGQPAYPGMTLRGGTFAGLPVIASQYVTTTAEASPVILVNASDIFLADDGQIVIDASREASLQMDGAPTAGATTLVSMFQSNMIAIRCEKFCNWAKRRAGAVAFIAATKWGQAEPP